MGILKNQTNKGKNGLRTMVKNINLDTVLNNVVIKENIPALLHTSTANDLPVRSFINKQLEENNAELEAYIKSRTHELISDDMVKAVKSVLKAQADKNKVENEIATIKRKIDLLHSNDSIDIDIEKMQLEIEADKKEEELKHYRKVFVDLYREAFDNTLIPSELYNIYIELLHISGEFKEMLEHEIELMQAKKEALKIILMQADVLEIMEKAIKERIEAPVAADAIVKSSEKQIPLIKILIK